MGEICRHRIHPPSAWRAADIGGREGLIHRLGREHLEAFDEFIGTTRDVPTLALGRCDFRSPPIDALMAAVHEVIVHGYGAVVLSGFDPRHRPLADSERIYWYLGTHLGTGAIQSAKGDRIGFVRHEHDNPTGRGYLSDMELGPHTDFHEILSLASVSQASEGGESGLTSCLAVHNAILETRPELLPPLYEGYYSGLEAQHGITAPTADVAPGGDTKVPIYCHVGGKVSCFTMSFWWAAAQQRGEALPEDLAAAMKYMGEQARRDDLQARFTLAPGEMMFWNNRTNFHARTKFRNAPGHERLLMRLWLNVDDPRPVAPEIAAFGRSIDRIHEERSRAA